LVDDPERVGEVHALGLDESCFQGANPARHTSFITGFVDVERSRLIDVVQERSARAVDEWLATRTPGWLATIEAVALDPHRGYATGLRRLLGHANQVVDHFHVIRLGNQAIDDVRRRVQQQQLGHRGRRDDPLYGIRRQLLVAHERLSDTAWAKVVSALDEGDPHDEVGATYWAKELLRDVFAARTRHEAHWRLVAFYQWCVDTLVPEALRLARTISAWENEILNYFDTRLSNGPTEAMNLLVKKIKRVGHGYRSFPNYRLRLLLHCGVEWHTHRAARLRGRQPRLIA
jgi:transposase